MGLLGRYNMSMWGFGQNPLESRMPGVAPNISLPGFPMIPQWQQQPQQADMPWGDGKSFGDLYQPQPKPRPPAQPHPSAAAFAPLAPTGARPQITASPLTPLQNSMPDMQPQPGQMAEENRSAAQANGGDIFGDAGRFFSEITSDREDGFNRTDLLQLGLSLLGNSQNGQGWAGVANDFGNIQQGVERRQDRVLAKEDRAREIKRQEEADARAKEEFEAWRKEQQRVAGLTSRYEEALKDPSLDAEARRMLGIMGPEGYGQYEMWRAEQAARSKETKENREFEASERQKDRAASAEEARIRSANENSIGRYFQAQDAQTIGESNAAAAQIQSRGLPMLNAVKADIQKAHDLGLQRGFFDQNQKITMNRMFGENGPLATTLETWRARVLGPALETLRGLGAMSEREMEAAVNSFSNPDMTFDAAMSLIDERIKLAENKLLENKTMNQFFTEAQGLTGKRNPAGQDWNTALTLAFEEDRRARELKAPPQPAPTVEKMGGGQGAVIPPNAITLLKQNPTLEMRRMFDQKYGNGSADKVLGTAQPGGYRGR